MTTMFGITVAAADEFVPPGPNSFDFSAVPLFHVGEYAVTKPLVQLLLGTLVVFVFFYAATRRAALVPSRMQFAGESAYGMVRNSIGRDIIGSHDFQRFVPYLVTLFFFILVNNVFASIPLIQFPTFSRASMAYALAALSWVIYNVAGIRRHGFMGYLKHQTVPPGIKGPMLVLLVPLEFMSNILVRPVTLALRLFANMFAGHLLLILFATGGAALLASGNILYGAVGLLSFGLGIGVSFLEMLVMFLQAYVFTLLSSMYIGEALADEH